MPPLSDPAWLRFALVANEVRGLWSVLQVAPHVCHLYHLLWIALT